MGRLGIDRSKSAVAKHERRSAEACHLEFIWNLRNPDGGESCADATEDEAKIRFGRKTRSCATLNIAMQTIDDIVGKRSREEATQSLRRNGSVDIPNPTYGYLGGKSTHSRADRSMSLQ